MTKAKLKDYDKEQGYWNVVKLGRSNSGEVNYDLSQNDPHIITMHDDPIQSEALTRLFVDHVKQHPDHWEYLEITVEEGLENSTLMRNEFSALRMLGSQLTNYYSDDSESIKMMFVHLKGLSSALMGEGGDNLILDVLSSVTAFSQSGIVLLADAPAGIYEKPQSYKAMKYLHDTFSNRFDCRSSTIAEWTTSINPDPIVLRLYGV